MPVFEEYRIDGIAKFSDGAVATKVWMLDTTTGSLMAIDTPNPTTGAFSTLTQQTDCYVMMFRAGYRPLAHGPVTPHT